MQHARNGELTLKWTTNLLSSVGRPSIDAWRMKKARTTSSIDVRTNNTDNEVVPDDSTGALLQFFNND
jgi:hypothetical protein